MTHPPLHEMTPQLEPSLRWVLSFTRGYLELGMIREAVRELDQLDLDDKCRSEVLDLRIQVLLARRHWRKADQLARAAIRMFPGLIEFYRHAANACEARGDLAGAKRTWCSVPSLFHQSGYFHYKIAGYEAQLGNADRAEEHIALALRLDPSIVDDCVPLDLPAKPTA